MEMKKEMKQRNEEHEVIAVISRGNRVRHFSDRTEYDAVYDVVYSDGVIERWEGNEHIGTITNEYRLEEK